MRASQVDPSKVTADELLDRLEPLVVRFLAHRWRSPRTLWRLQLDLLRLQRDVQAAISVAKKDRTAAGRSRIGELRQVMWHARRFGDALAWTFFRNDRRVIDPLTYNARVPVLPDGHGSRGLVAAAEALSPRFGFPLLHDITDVLRVGDITFFKPEERPQAVEIKTSLAGSEDEGSKTVLSYNVTAIWPAGGTPPSDVPLRRIAADRKPVNARVGRQLARMTRALALQDAPVGAPTKVDGRQTLILESKDAGERSDHWALLRRMIRRARRTGYASAVADGAVMYVAFYSPTGLDSPDQLMGRVPADLLASGIFLPDPKKNSLYVLGMPDPTHDGPHRYRPYYLYPFPRPWVVDILRGRLVILALFNPGRVAEALEAVGVRADDGKGNAYLRAFAEVEADSSKFLVELPLGDNITEMVMEARTLAGLVAVADTLVTALREQLPTMMRDEGLID
jgi:hypothetical protein